MKHVKSTAPRAAGSAAFLAALLLAAVSCSVPFEVETDTFRVTLSSTAGLTAEQSIAVPDDARRSGVDYDRVDVHYVITKSGNFPVDVTLYVSPDRRADGVRGSGDETLVRTSLGAGDDTISGSTRSRVLRDVLNRDQERFVIGGSVSSLDPGQEVTVEAFAEVRGDYRVFP